MSSVKPSARHKSLIKRPCCAGVVLALNATPSYSSRLSSHISKETPRSKAHNSISARKAAYKPNGVPLDFLKENLNEIKHMISSMRLDSGSKHPYKEPEVKQVQAFGDWSGRQNSLAGSPIKESKFALTTIDELLTVTEQLKLSNQVISKDKEEMLKKTHTETYLRAQVESLKSQLLSYVTNSTALEQLKFKIKDQETELKKSLQENSQLKSELGQKIVQLSSLKDQLKILQREKLINSRKQTTNNNEPAHEECLKLSEKVLLKVLELAHQPSVDVHASLLNLHSEMTQLLAKAVASTESQAQLTRLQARLTSLGNECSTLKLENSEINTAFKNLEEKSIIEAISKNQTIQKYEREFQKIKSEYECRFEATKTTTTQFKNQIDQLKANIAQLQSSKDTLISQMTTIRSENNSLNTELIENHKVSSEKYQILLNNYQSIQKKLETVNKEKSTVQSKKEALQAQNNHLKQQIQDTKLSLESTTAELRLSREQLAEQQLKQSKLFGDTSRQKQTIDQKIAIIQQIDIERQSLLARIQGLQNDLIDSEREVKTIQAKHLEQETILISFRQENGFLKEENSQLSTRAIVLHDKVGSDTERQTELENTVTELTHRLNSAQTVIGSLTEESKALSISLHAKNTTQYHYLQEIDNLQANLSAKEKEISHIKMTIESLKNEISFLKASNSNQEKQLEELRSHSLSSEDKLDKQKTQYASQNSRMRQLVASLEREKEKCVAQWREHMPIIAQDPQKALSQLLSETFSMYIETQASSAKKQQQIVSKNISIGLLTDKVSVYENQKTYLHTKLAEEKEAASVKIRQLDYKIKSQEKLLQVSEKKISELQSLIRSMEQKCEQLLASNEAMCRKNLQLKTQIKSQKDTLQEQSNSISSLRLDLHNSSQRLQHLQSQFTKATEHYESTTLNYKQQIYEVQDKFSASSRHQESHYASLAQAKATLERTVQTLRHKLTQRQTDIQTKQKAINRLEELLSDNHNLLEEQSQHKTMLMAEINKMKAKLQSQNGEMSSLKGDLISMQQQIVKEREQSSTFRGECSRLQLTISNTVRECETQRQRLEAANGQQRTQLQMQQVLTDETRSLRELIQRQQQEIDKLSRTIRVLRQQNNTLSRTMDEQIEQRKAIIEQLIQEKKTLYQQLGCR